MRLSLADCGWRCAPSYSYMDTETGFAQKDANTRGGGRPHTALGAALKRGSELRLIQDLNRAFGRALTRALKRALRQGSPRAMREAMREAVSLAVRKALNEALV